LRHPPAPTPPRGGPHHPRASAYTPRAAARGAAPRLKPEGLTTQSYGRKYFGPGPDAADGSDGTADWAGPLAGGTGAVLLVAGVVLWRGRRRDADRTRPGYDH
ncbi:hypothetical protein ABZX38_26670, partial [Streptomyces longwoodensis]